MSLGFNIKKKYVLMFELVIIMQFLTKDWSNLHDKQAQIIRHTKLFPAKSTRRSPFVFILDFQKSSVGVVVVHPGYEKL